MKELSIFVDESGDFGDYAEHSSYYIVSLVLHNQAIDISQDILKLEEKLANLGYPEHCIHSGPIIRNEQEYRKDTLLNRQKLLKTLMTFFRRIEVSCKTIYIEEKNIAAATALCSCGIAYVMKYVQACVQAGIELGIRPADGKDLVAQTLKGAAMILEAPDANPAKEIEAVCTPGGYTIRGINQLDHDGFPSAIINAMKACMY